MNDYELYYFSIAFVLFVFFQFFIWKDPAKTNAEAFILVTLGCFLWIIVAPILAVIIPIENAEHKRVLEKLKKDSVKSMKDFSEEEDGTWGI